MFSMDDLRARLDAPLFHRDQGLSTPAQLPRLRELSFDQAEVPLPLAVPETPTEGPVEAPVAAFADDVAAALHAALSAEIAVETELALAPPRERPKLASFSELMSASALQQEAEIQVAPAPEPEPIATPEPDPEPEVSTQPALGESETDALLAVVAASETSANRLYEMGARVSDDAPLAASEISSVVPEAIMPLPVAELNITPAHGQRSAIEAELNRLAFLPDQEEPGGRVEVPQIAMAHVEPRAVGVPVLSKHEMYNPRATPTMPTAKRVSFESAFGATAPRRRSKKGAVRRVISLVLTLAILGGGLYAAKFYLLDPKWDPAVKVLADEVEATRLLEFDHAVEVTALSADEYSTRIASYALDIHDGNQEKVGSEMRALGLLNGVLDLRAIGLAALPETPAFFDAGSEKIYVVIGLPTQTYRFAMYRALTAALLDQHYGWGGNIDGASPSVVRGTRALYEADALATASSMLTPSDLALVIEQRAALYTTFTVPTTPSQFATTVAGRLGVSLRAFVEAFPLAERGRMLRDAVITDGQALDLRRLVRGVADAAADPLDALRQEPAPASGSQGMLFWYHVLASRLDVATAWNNALPIQFDDMTVTAGATGDCVAATLTVTAAALDGVGAAFTAWASLAPAESATTVVPSLDGGIGHIAISACDLGLAVATNNGQVPLSLGGAPLRSEQYRLLKIAQPTLTNSQAACAVYDGDTVSATDDRLVVDPIEGWAVPSVHPVPDSTRPECAAV